MNNENLPQPKPTTPLRDEDLVAPRQMPPNVSKAIAKYGDALDAIGNELAKQNSIITRNLGYSRTINEDLGEVEFLLGQKIENYQEALDDFETQERKKETRKKFVNQLISPFKKKQQEPPKNQTTFQPPKPPEKPWWDIFPKKTNDGKNLSQGGVSTSGIGTGEIIPPGIYDNPTRGQLAPGTAVVPFNRSYGKKILNQLDQRQYIQSLGDVLSLPTKSLLGFGVTVLGASLKSFGPLVGYFNQSVPGLISVVSSILEMSRSSVINMLGGPAYAGVVPNDADQDYFNKSWRVFMNKNNLYFPGAPGVFGGPKPPIEIAPDILVIGPNGEGLGGFGGTNVGKLPAWIPFSKSDSGKIYYTSGFGVRWFKNHNGIDLASNLAIKIITPFAGEVYDVNRGAVKGDRAAGGGYGNLVAIAHENPKIFTFYGHLQDVADSIEVGKKVSAGQVIGSMGDTGYSFGPHLHWEVRKTKYGDQIDPVEWTHQNKPGFQGGGGLSTKGVRVGATGLPKQGFDALKDAKSQHFGSKGLLSPRGRGVYQAPRVGQIGPGGFRPGSGGARYHKGGSNPLNILMDMLRGKPRAQPGGVLGSISPGGVRATNLFEPQRVVNPKQFQKGQQLFQRVQSGRYQRSALANRLREQASRAGFKLGQVNIPFNQLPKATASVGSNFLKLGKLGSKILGVAGPILDLAFPEPTTQYDQISGPNAYYNAPEYKPKQSVRTIEMSVPSTPSSTSSRRTNSIQFVTIDIPTDVVMSTSQMRRI